VQLTSGRDKGANLEKTERLVAQAASTGADVVALPEKWNVIGPPDVLHDTAETIEDGESVEAMRKWARTHGVTLIGGSITERREGREKLSNTCLVFDPEGELASLYRKIHLFDVEVGGLTYRESEAEEHGEEPVVTEVEGWPVGLTICYDLRFPELYRVLALEGRLRYSAWEEEGKKRSKVEVVAYRVEFLSTPAGSGAEVVPFEAAVA